jgi:hypothetical protein
MMKLVMFCVYIHATRESHVQELCQNAICVCGSLAAWDRRDWLGWRDEFFGEGE